MTTKRESWEVFARSGVLWFVNRVLYAFGWQLDVEQPDEDMGGPFVVYPVRVCNNAPQPDGEAWMREVFLKHVGRTRIPRETDPAALPEDDQARLERLRQMTVSDE